MDYFRYEGGRLLCEDVPLEDIAREVGTPVYVYSMGTLARHFKVFDEAFAEIPHIVCFAMKANSNAAVVATFAGMGGGADVVPGTHPYISTGLRKNKFGIAIERALEEYRTAAGLANVEVVGIHQHIGSQ